jgi:hypothetical protein
MKRYMILERLNNLGIKKTKEFLMKKPSLNGSKLIDSINLRNFMFLAKILNSHCRSEYEHPLVVGNVRRKARTLGVEIKTVNEWE